VASAPRPCPPALKRLHRLQQIPGSQRKTLRKNASSHPEEGLLGIPRFMHEQLVGVDFDRNGLASHAQIMHTPCMAVKQSEGGALDVTAFYLRRVLRILPLCFGFLLAATTLARSLVPDENLPLKYVVAFALLCGNWACVLWGYPHSVATPLWSVSIEEQFYLC